MIRVLGVTKRIGTKIAWEPALDKPGTVQNVKGHRIELVRLLVDEHGNVAAIAKADYSYPENYSVRLNEQLIDTRPQTEEEAVHYHVREPSPFRGEPAQIFWGFRDNSSPSQRWPDRVRLEIPVVEQGRLLGYAQFDNVPVTRVWEANYMLTPTNVPFWADSAHVPVSPATATAPAQP